MVDEFVPEKEWWKRAAAISMIPHDIRRQYFEVLGRFGPDIANLILLVRRVHGSLAARALANRIRSFKSIDDLLRYVASVASRLRPEDRELIARWVERVRWGRYLDEIRNAVETTVRVLRSRGVECDEERLRKYSVELVYRVYRTVGVLFNPDCVARAAAVVANCATDVPRVCRRVWERIERILGEVSGGRLPSGH